MQSKQTGQLSRENEANTHNIQQERKRIKKVKRNMNEYSTLAAAQMSHSFFLNNFYSMKQSQLTRKFWICTGAQADSNFAIS